MPGVESRTPSSLFPALAADLRGLAEHKKRRAEQGGTHDDEVWDPHRVADGQQKAVKDAENPTSNVKASVFDRAVLSPVGGSLRSAASAKGTTTKLWDAHPALALALQGLKVHHIADGGMENTQHLAKAMILQHKLRSNFYTIDLGRLLLLYEAFVEAVPRVQPFYAVKCNPDPVVLKTLAALGCGFDCASAAEMRRVLDLGVPASRIIFAHPCKLPDDLQCAVEHNVTRMTYDCEDELDKIAEEMPNAELVLRIKVDDASAIVQFGHKYGAEPSREAPALLRAARQRGMSVVGVSFHIGSGNQSAEAYQTAIRAAREVFDVGKTYGYDMSLLDLGGGFYGRFDPSGRVSIGDAAYAINDALASCFPTDTFSDLKVIAEPGRYFAESISTFFSMVHTTKCDRDESGNVRNAKYYICDGVYGSFNGIVYDHGFIAAQVLRGPQLPEPSEHQQTSRPPSTVFGPTCDGVDLIFKDVPMPLLRRGDWLQVPNYGAYSIAGACNFNGIPVDAPHTAYVWSARPVGNWEAAHNITVKRGHPAQEDVRDVPEQRLTFHSTLGDLDSI